MNEAFHFYRPQRSCGKVMFSRACVIPSVHGGAWVCLGEICIHGGMPMGGLHPGGSALGVGHTPMDTTGHGHRAGGTHPIGIHSCLKGKSETQCSLYSAFILYSIHSSIFIKNVELTCFHRTFLDMDPGFELMTYVTRGVHKTGISMSSKMI